VCRYAISASKSSGCSAGPKGGITPLPPTIVCRTCASVAGAPLGSVDFWNRPSSFGGCVGSETLLDSWHGAQFVSYISLPRAICAADEPEWEHAVSPNAASKAAIKMSGLNFRPNLLALGLRVARDLDVFKVRVVSLNHDVGANDVVHVQSL
jgi:hypothetical protein